MVQFTCELCIVYPVPRSVQNYMLHYVRRMAPAYVAAKIKALAFNIGSKYTHFSYSKRHENLVSFAVS